MISLHRIVAPLVAAFLPLGLSAAPITDMIFDPGILSGLAPGTELVYDYEKVVPRQPEAEVNPDVDPVTGFAEGSITLTLVEGAEDGRGVEIVMSRDGEETALPTMSAAGGNPLVVVFLEQVARTITGLSGGSPFYIRNRMKEALLVEPEYTPATVSVDGTETAVDRVTLTPLAGDPNTDKMRGLDALSLTFTYGDDVPGGIVALDAELLNDEGVAVYREAMSFEHEEAPR